MRIGDVVEEIKRRVDLVEIASAYVKLKRVGRNWEGLCPFHREKTPSFYINPEKQLWYCFGCGAGGDVFAFVQKAENLTFREALEKLAGQAGVQLPVSPEYAKASDEREKLRRACEIAARFYQECLKRSPDALSYLKKRGIKEETSEAFRLGYAPNSWTALADRLRQEGVDAKVGIAAGLLAHSERGSLYDRFRNRVMFPVCDVTGRVVAFGGRILEDTEGVPKYLNSPETPLFSKGSTLYGLHLARNSIAENECAVLVEGYMDVISLHQSGVTNAVATLGTSLTAEQLRLLGRYTRTCVLLYDCDSAGLKAALRSIPLFEESGIDVRIGDLPAGDDPDSFVRREGAAALAKVTAEAKPVLDYRMGLLIREHGTDTLDARRRLVAAAVPVLASVSNNLDRSRWTRKLAEIWVSPRMEMAAAAEENIAREVSEYRRRAQSKGGTSAPRANDVAGFKVPVGFNRVIKAQEFLLRACLESRDAAEATFSELRPEHFTEGAHRQLAEIVAERLGDDAWDVSSWDLGEGSAAVLAARLMSDPEPVLPESALAECRRLVRSHWEREQVRELIRKSEEGKELSYDELKRIEQSRLMQQP